MPNDRRAELGLDPEGLREKFCPACGELRPVCTERDDYGSKSYSCAVCGASLAEEAAGSFDAPASDFPDA